MSDVRFSFADLAREISAFRAAFGTRTFWARPEMQRAAAANAIGFVYLRMDGTPEELERAATAVHATLGEYARRASYAGVSV